MTTHPFTPTQRQQLIAALLDAFASRHELDRLVRAAFDCNPQTIIAERVNLTRAVEEVVEEAASREGGVRRLLTVATQERTDNVALAQLVQDWQDVEFEIVHKPNTTLGQTIQTDGGPAIGGNVHTGHDFIGRDKITEGDEVDGDKVAGDKHVIGTQNIYYGVTQSTATTEDTAPAPGESPYRGMEYFDVGDADLFFGREHLTAELVDHLRHNPLLAIVGASGSGKSSLARAGLIPALQGTKPLIDGSQPPKGSPRWVYHIITPTSRPLESLAASLTRHSESVTATSTLIDDLRKDARSLHLAARRLVSSDQRLLLLVDQFEELFTLCKDESEQRAFVANLLHAAQPDGVVTLVLTLRADFYHHCARFPELRNALEHQQKYIGSMSHDELRRAIEDPAKAGKWEFQEGLVEQLLNDVGDEPGALPLLSHALLETWKRRSGRRMTLAGYLASGRVQGAIAKSADAIYNDFNEAQQRIARTIFLRLTELGEGGPDTRRRVRPAELKLPQTSPEEVQTVLKTLADARLVTTDNDEVQIAHEALIRYWGTLSEWLNDDHDGNRIHRRLTEAANQWMEFAKDPNQLYRGVLLHQAQEWQQITRALLSQQEMEFLDESQSEVEATRKRNADFIAEREASQLRELRNQIHYTRRLRNRLAATVIISLVAVIVAGISLYLGNQLGKANNTLQRMNDELGRKNDIAVSRQLAIESGNELRSHNYELAILLGIESGRSADTLEAFSSIRFAIANPWHIRQIFYDVTQTWWNHDASKILAISHDNTAYIWDVTTSKKLLTLKGHIDSVTLATWSQDESKILTVSTYNIARIWDAATGKELVSLVGHKDAVTQATWSHDESRILTTSTDATARIWDTATGKELVSLVGHKGAVTQATWSHDESRILTTSTDATARIWDAATGKELVSLVGHKDAVTQATWSHDESRILTTSTDATARIWDTATGMELLKLDRVAEARWNQGANKLLTTGDDPFNNDVRIWDVATGKELIRFEGSEGIIYRATWNKDETKILTVSNKGIAQVWDSTTGKELINLKGIIDAIWNKGGNKIFTNSNSSIRIWDAATGNELSRLEGNSAYRATWNKDETMILTSGNHDDIRIWDVTSGNELVKLEGVYQATWGKDKSEIFTRSDNGIVQIWNTSTNKGSVKRDVHAGSNYQAIWSQDGSKILTSSQDDSIVHIWDTLTGKELVRLKGNMGSVYQATWNRDETKILTTSSDGTARIWNAAAGKELIRFAAEPRFTGCTVVCTYFPWKATWNKSENRILTTSNYGTAHIWDVTTGKELVRLEGHQDIVNQATWNRDGTKILTSSEDGSVRIWDAATGKELVMFEEYPTWVTWNKDGTKILTRDFATVKIMDAVTGKELVRFKGHTSFVTKETWNQDESKILTTSADDTARIWDAVTGKELVRLEGVDEATWNGDGSKILTHSADGTVRIWYVQMKDLLEAGCQWVPRNFTWSEWSQYMADNVGDYRPTCLNAPIPPDAIEGIQNEVRQQILAGQVLSGTQRLDELNGWLQENGQFDSFGVDVQAFVAGVSATATVEAGSSPAVTPEP